MTLLGEFLGPESADGDPTFLSLTVRVVAAGLIGAFVAFRPWRRLFGDVRETTPPRLVHAQVLMAIVGAVMVVVIGGSPARAFGLVGLGSFVRFRSGITDPRESVVLLMMIGLGMACGIGLLEQAAAAAVLMAIVLAVFDQFDRNAERLVRIMISSGDPRETRLALRAAFPKLHVLDESTVGAELGKVSGQLLVEIPLRGNPDVARLWQLFETSAVPGVRRIAIVTED